MDIQQLEMFVAVAEEGSIHGGARRLLVAQPTLSKALQKLERQLSTQLLIRSPQGIGLTVAGKVLLDQAREILQRLGQSVELVKKAGNPTRQLTVGLIAGAVSAAELTSSILREYKRSRPDVNVIVRELDFPNQFKSITDGLVDVALVRPPCPSPEVALTPLFDEPILLCLREDHPLAAKDQLEVADLGDQLMLDMVDAPAVWTDFWMFRNELQTRPETAQTVHTVSELSLALASSDRTVMPLASSAWRLGVTGRSPLTVIPVRDAPRSVASVATLRGDEREEVAEFRTLAIDIVRQHIRAIPDADPRF